MLFCRSGFMNWIGVTAAILSIAQPTIAQRPNPSIDYSEQTNRAQHSSTDKIFPRMVAEFEPQQAVMVSVSDLQPHHTHVLKQIVRASAGHGQILILFNNNSQLKHTLELLIDVPNDHIRFHRLPLDTVWLRDFGPRIAEEENGIRSLDFYYYGVRPQDDSFPARWALSTAGMLTKVPWTLQGGNLISNGGGMGITTEKIFEENQVTFPGQRPGSQQSRQFVIKELKASCNLQHLVVLKPLRNEPTKHVDMFAAFVARDHALVAKIDPRQDSSNSKILDYNAQLLATQVVDGRKLQVSRIPIPPRDGNTWSTYTNAIFTDRMVLIPTMKSDGNQYIQQAVETYHRLLPGHHLATIDITSMKKLQGSLHCMSLNLPAIAPTPKRILSYAQATQLVSKTPPSNSRFAGTNPVQAKSTHTIDKQLRRIFKSAHSEYLVDAYAVGLSSGVVSLLKSQDQKLIRVKLAGICKADQYWVQRNADKIRSNGNQVYRFILSRDR